MAISHDMGAYGEALAMAYFSRLGYQVFYSQGSHSPADLFVLRGDERKSVEVRMATYYKDGRISTNVKVSPADVLFVVDPHRDVQWVIPGDVCRHIKSTMQLDRWKPTKSGQRRKRKVAINVEDYRVNSRVFPPHHSTTETVPQEQTHESTHHPD